MLCIVPLLYYRDISLMYIKTHSSVSAAKKTKEDVWHVSVSFTGTIKLPNLAFHISKTTKLISTKFIYFLPYIHIHTLLHMSKLKKIASAFTEIQYHSFITSLLYTCTCMASCSIWCVKIHSLPWKILFPQDKSWYFHDTSHENSTT